MGELSPATISVMELENPVFIAQGGFPRMKELSRMLLASDIPSEIVEPPGGSGKG